MKAELKVYTVKELCEDQTEGIDLAVDISVGFKSAQRAGEHLLRDVGDVPDTYEQKYLL